MTDLYTLISFPISSVAHTILTALPTFTDPRTAPAARAAAALAAARIVTRGRGRSFVATTDPEASGVIWQQGLIVDADESRPKTHRAAMREVTARINMEIRGIGWTYPTTTTLPQERRFVVPIGPGEERRNTALFTGSKHWRGVDDDYAIIGGPGEPTRTPADVRVAVADLIERYLALWPMEQRFSQAAIAVAATVITADHYPVPAAFHVSRRSLRIYLEAAEQAR